MEETAAAGEGGAGLGRRQVRAVGTVRPKDDRRGRGTGGAEDSKVGVKRSCRQPKEAEPGG